MDLRNGLSFVAFGFFFTLVNLNLTLGGGTINATPDFIGWILFFMAFDRLGDYAANRKVLKWVSFVLILFSAAVWICEIARPELDLGAVKTVVSIVSAVYMFLLFEVLEQIARDFESRREGTLHMLKILNPLLTIVFVVLALAGAALGSGALITASAVVGMAALAASVVTMVVLFRLRGDVLRKLPET